MIPVLSTYTIPLLIDGVATAYINSEYVANSF